MTLHEAILYEKMNKNRVQCNLCARRCKINDGAKGFCLVRKNENGILNSLVYGKAVSAAVDPIGKKPLSHFHPGALVLSVAAAGCNFRCKFCDNWMISQDQKISGKNFRPDEVVKAARESNCLGISYTYTEPTVFIEYVYDIAKLAHQVGFFNTFVTNGYLTPVAVKTIAPLIDATTVDFKGGGDPDFYKKYASVPTVEPIYEALKEFRRNNVHIEITNLVIPKIGDSMSRIKEMATWIKETLGKDTPFHLLRFHPDYKMTTTSGTDLEIMEKAYMTARNVGLQYVYLGNLTGHPAENTFCPKCNEPLIKRHSYEITRWNLTKDMQCPVCEHKIPIIGQLHQTGARFPYALF